MILKDIGRQKLLREIAETANNALVAIGADRVSEGQAAYVIDAYETHPAPPPQVVRGEGYSLAEASQKASEILLQAEQRRRDEAAPHGGGEYFSAAEINIFRQWYNALKDTNMRYLDEKDAELAARLGSPKAPAP